MAKKPHARYIKVEANVPELIANSVLPGLRMSLAIIQEEIAKYERMLGMGSHIAEEEPDDADLIEPMPAKYRRPATVRPVALKPKRSPKMLAVMRRNAAKGRKAQARGIKEFKRLGGSGNYSKAKLEALKAKLNAANNAQ